MTDSKTTDLDTVSEKSQEAPVQQAAQTPAAETEKKPAVRTTRAAAGRKTAAKTAAKTTKPAAKSAAKPAARRSSSRKAAAVEVDGKVDLTEPSLYTNREISWIEFDRKVLETAIDASVPLLERVKFLSIFFNKRYLKRLGNDGAKSASGVGFGDSAMTAMFIGLVCAYIGSYIGAFVSGEGLFTCTGDWTPLIVVAVSAAVMALFVYLSEKKNMAWLESFSIAGSMLIGMAAAVLVRL